MHGVLLRFVRPYRAGEPLKPNETTQDLRCTVELCKEFPNCDHSRILGVYRKENLGVLVGGNLIEKVDSYIRIKFANLKLRVKRILN